VSQKYGNKVNIFHRLRFTRYLNINQRSKLLVMSFPKWDLPLSYLQRKIIKFCKITFHTIIQKLSDYLIFTKVMIKRSKLHFRKFIEVQGVWNCLKILYRWRPVLWTVRATTAILIMLLPGVLRITTQVTQVSK